MLLKCFQSGFLVGRETATVWVKCALADCAGFSELPHSKDGREQSPPGEFLDESCDICTAEFLWSPALHQRDSRRFLKCLFSSAWFPTAGWSAGVRCRVAQLFPEREQAGALGAIPGQLRDQLNSQHSSHSPFEGKANREGGLRAPLSHLHTERGRETVLVSGLITR